MMQYGSAQNRHRTLQLFLSLNAAVRMLKTYMQLKRSRCQWYTDNLRI